MKARGDTNNCIGRTEFRVFPEMVAAIAFLALAFVMRFRRPQMRTGLD